MGDRFSSRPGISSPRRWRSSSSMASRADSSFARPICLRNMSPSSPRTPRWTRSCPTGTRSRPELQGPGPSSRVVRGSRPPIPSGTDDTKRNGSSSPPARPARRRWSCTHVEPDGRDHSRQHAGQPPSCGAPSTTSAAMAACRSSSGRSSAADRCVLSERRRAPSATTSSGSARTGSTHVSGTPSHWRRALMSPAARGDRAPLRPLVRRNRGPGDPRPLSDAFYPQASDRPCLRLDRGRRGDSTSTTASRGFRRAWSARRGDVEIEVADGSLRIRSARTAVRYLGEDQARRSPTRTASSTPATWSSGAATATISSAEGAAIINVGGLKVHPEEVEAVINRHPAVRMSMVRSGRSPITGALVAADVVLRTEPDSATRAGPRARARDPAALPRRLAPAQGSGDDPLRAGPRPSPPPASWRVHA